MYHYFSVQILGQLPFSSVFCFDRICSSLLATSKFHISRADRKTVHVVSQMVVLPQTKSPHHEGVMKITTFLSLNNENLGAIAHMSNGT